MEYLCVPHTISNAITINCIKNGLHIFCEKPPSINLEEITQVKNIYGFTKNKTILMYGFNHRYLNHIQKAREIINKETLGKIQYIRGIYGKSFLENWRAEQKFGGKGILLSQGIHMLDLFRFLTGKEYKVIDAYINHYNKKWYEDNVMALLQSEDSKIGAFIHSSCILKKNTFNINIGFEYGYMEIDGLSCSSTCSFGFPDTLTIGYSKQEDFYGNPKIEKYFYGKESGENSWKIQVDEFIDAIINNKKDYSCNIYDALQVMKLVEEIYGKELI